MKTLSTLAVLYNAISNVNSHSWVECVDYVGVINGQDYNENSCQAHPRNWENEGSSLFGSDVGADFRPASGGTWCKHQIGSPTSYSGSYSANYPMAQYTPGSTYRVVWPAKNHANYECFSNIPDASMKLYYNPIVNPTADPTYTSNTDLTGWSLAYDYQEGCTPGEDECGFQNCPLFCDDTGLAPCFQDTVLPANLFSTSGVYTFMWYWAFNNEEDIYTTCWEAYVDTNGVVTEPEEGNGNNNNNNNNNNDREYLIQVPICYIGGTYNEDLLQATASSLYPEQEWFITSVSQGNNEFNATLQTHTDESSVVSSITSDASNNNHEFCTILIQLMGNTGSCSSCQDVEVLRDSQNSNKNKDEGDSTGSAIIAVVVVLIIVLLIIGAGIGYQKMQDKRVNSNDHVQGITTHIGAQPPQQTQQNIVQA